MKKEITPQKRIITFGTFDVFHLGHLNILERAKSLGSHLTVGVSSDRLNYLKKKRLPIYSEHDRLKIISNIRFVDQTFTEESLDLKEFYIRKYKADILVMGSDWTGKFDHLKSFCNIIYLPRTKDISTTEIIHKIKKYQ